MSCPGLDSASPRFCHLDSLRSIASRAGPIPFRPSWSSRMARTAGSQQQGQYLLHYRIRLLPPIRSFRAPPLLSRRDGLISLLRSRPRRSLPHPAPPPPTAHSRRPLVVPQPPLL